MNFWIGFIMGIGFTLGGLYMLIRNIYLAHYGISTQAKIKTTKKFISNFYYEFLTEKNELIKKDIFWTEDSMHDEAVVNIYYNPKKPKQFIIDNPMNVYPLPIMILLMGLANLYIMSHQN